MNQLIRSFIAVELNQGIKDELKNIQEDLKKLNLEVIWVETDNIHLTLKFLGYVDAQVLENIKTILKETAVSFKPFEISLSGLGVFPKIDSPRVIWAGLNQGKDELIKMAAALEENLKKLGFTPEDREFSPHLTLGRVRSAKNKNKLKNYFTSSKPDFTKRQEIKTLTLFQSRLSPKGAAYTALASFSFLCP